MSRIAVIGAGNIGSIISSHLVRAGNEVALVEVIKPRADRIKRYGIRMTDYHKFEVDGESYEEILYDTTKLSGFKPEAVFISTKATALEPVTKSLAKIDLSDSHLVSAQNGLDTEVYISERLKTQKVHRMVINFVGNEIEVKETEPITIRMGWSKGPNKIGSLYPQYKKIDQELADLLSSADLETEYSENFRKSVWEKVILNSTLCPICALTYTTMGQAMEYKPSRELTEKVLIEGLEVAKADGYDFGKDALEKFMGYLERGGPHEPSMLIDVKNNKRTEIDWINGKILEYGKKYNIETPYNSALTALVRSLDEFRRPCLSNK